MKTSSSLLRRTIGDVAIEFVEDGISDGREERAVGFGECYAFDELNTLLLSSLDASDVGDR